MLKDIKLGLTSHDIAIEDNTFSFVEGADRVGQQIKIRILWFLGEWFLDTNRGVPWFEEIFVKNPDIAEIEAQLKVEIATVPNVKEITQWSSDLDVKTRTYTVRSRVDTEFGPITIEETIP